MNVPKPKLDKEEQKAQALLNHLANERIHNLVVKIISWKSGIVDGAIIQESNKISKSEWDQYRKHILKISKVESEDKVKEKLKAVYTAIQRHNGFE